MPADLSVGIDVLAQALQPSPPVVATDLRGHSPRACTDPTSCGDSSGATSACWHLDQLTCRAGPRRPAFRVAQVPRSTIPTPAGTFYTVHMVLAREPDASICEPMRFPDGSLR